DLVVKANDEEIFPEEGVYTVEIDDEDIIVTISSVLIAYSVTFDSDGGSDVDPQEVEDGETADEPENPIKDGYTFDGWYDGEDEWDFNDPVTKDLVLKAKWDIVADDWYTVTFDPANGEATFPVFALKASGKLNAPADPVWIGFEFIGWYDGEDEWDFDDDVVTEDMTLTARWIEIVIPEEWFTVTVTSAEGGEFEYFFDGVSQGIFVILAGDEHTISVLKGTRLSISALDLEEGYNARWVYGVTKITATGQFNYVINNDLDVAVAYFEGQFMREIEVLMLVILSTVVGAPIFMAFLCGMLPGVITIQVSFRGRLISDALIEYSITGKSGVNYVSTDSNGKMMMKVPLGSEITIQSISAGGSGVTEKMPMTFIAEKNIALDLSVKK
ncbi:MAG: InlB B-repeat-containing protein, partial [Methanomassiliicoccaceae archaeon]|nr:InlB B-repeat-containing protein [Methanomassiliicoccaceae archaeon]